MKYVFHRFSRFAMLMAVALSTSDLVAATQCDELFLITGKPLSVDSAKERWPEYVRPQDIETLKSLRVNLRHEDGRLTVIRGGIEIKVAQTTEFRFDMFTMPDSTVYLLTSDFSVPIIKSVSVLRITSTKIEVIDPARAPNELLLALRSQTTMPLLGRITLLLVDPYLDEKRVSNPFKFKVTIRNSLDETYKLAMTEENVAILMKAAGVTKPEALVGYSRIIVFPEGALGTDWLVMKLVEVPSPPVP